MKVMAWEIDDEDIKMALQDLKEVEDKDPIVEHINELEFYFRVILLLISRMVK